MGCCGDNKVEDSDAAKEKKEQGEPREYDPTFKGPIKDRGCTDVLCCILFLIFMLGFIGVGAWAFAMGDPRILLYPSDSDGNICGYDDFESKPVLYFFDLLDCAQVGTAIISTGCPTPQVCIEECPDYYWNWYTVYAEELISGVDEDERKKMICDSSVDPVTTSKTIKELVEEDLCAPYIMSTGSVVGRCVPSAIATVIDEATNLVTANNTQLVDKLGNALNGTVLEEGVTYLSYLLNAAEYGSKILQDVRASWWLMLLFIGFGTLFIFLWIVLMRWLAGPIVWITLFLFLGIFAFGTYYCFTKWMEMKDNPENNGTFEFSTSLDYYTNLADTWLALGIIAAIFLGIMLIIFIFLRSRIKIAVALIKEASRGISSMIFTLFWPLVPFLLQVILLSYWVLSALFLASAGEKEFGATNVSYVNETDANGIVTTKKYITEIISAIPCDATSNSTEGEVCSFLKYGGGYTSYLQIYQLFMWLWCMNFIVAFGQMTLAGAFASYYWAFKKPKDLPLFPVTASVGRALRYHTGSLAFGALIIAIIQMIRICLEYIDYQLKGKDNKVAKFFMACLKCCFWCLEKFMKFINRNAYIMIAVYGKNFCSSALNAFQLILRNILRVAIVDSVTDVLIFISKLMCTGAVTILAFYFFSGDLANALPWDSISDYVDGYTPELNFYLVPVIIIGIVVFIIASAFFSVFSMGVDTLFLCFLLDLEMNDGSRRRPYYAPKELRSILGKKNVMSSKRKKKKK